jgi:hypothetical protein
MLEKETPAVDNAPPQEAKPHQITLRALVIGVLLIPLMCVWGIYTEVVVQSTEFSTMSLSLGIVTLLLVLIGLNAAIRKWLPRHAFSQQELMVIYTMQTVSLCISGVGMLEFLVTTLGNIYHFATPENHWADRYDHLLRSWAFPNPAYLNEFYNGRSTFFTSAHVLAWIQPILTWSVFILSAVGVMLCINIIIRRRWIDDERLAFPLVTLPLELSKNGGANPFWKSRALWFGFSLAVVLEILAGLASLYPNVPYIPLKASERPYDICCDATSLAGDAAPWSSMGNLYLAFYPMVIGLTFLMPLDVSFSCWFFYMVRNVENVVSTVFGFHSPGASPAASGMPYIGMQSGGAFLALALFSLYAMRGYLAKVFRAAFRPESAFVDPAEARSYRWALVGLVAGFVVMVGFAMALGLAWYLAAALWVLYLLVVITYTRIRAEAGLPWIFGPDMTPHQMVIAAAGTARISDQNLVGLTEFQWIDLDYRGTPMPSQLEAMKIGSESRIDQRRLVMAMILAIIVGIAVSWTTILECYYKYGADTAHVDSYRTTMGTSPWLLLDGWKSAHAPTDWIRIFAAGFGVIVTAILMACRARFPWWPFHPVGYALAGTYTMVWLWCPIMVGWLIKWIILRYGGLKSYRMAYPFFIGLILGDYVAGSFWAILGDLTGMQTYKVIPI